MDGLKHTLAAIPAGTTRRLYGTAYWDGSDWFANVNGNLISCRWASTVRPVQDGMIAVDLTRDEYGQSSALVICSYTDTPRPRTGSILSIGVTDIIVTGEDGLTFAATRYLGSMSGYAPGDKVYLDDDPLNPTILGEVSAVTVVTAGSPPPADAAPATGKETLVATKSNTWGVGGWGRWATSQGGGEDVYSGSWSGNTVAGAWFYGAKRPALAGKTITSAQFRLPQRLAVGASGPATVHLYAHTSSSQPGGDVNRTAGPFDVSVPQGGGPRWVTLPSSFHPVLANGGGISIAGDPYVGFASRLDDAESGKIIMKWSA